MTRAFVCGCEFDDDCNGAGTIYCVGCGGDLCICMCGGERPCEGCDWCTGDAPPPLEDDDGPAWSEP